MWGNHPALCRGFRLRAVGSVPGHTPQAPSQLPAQVSSFGASGPSGGSPLAPWEIHLAPSQALEGAGTPAHYLRTPPNSHQLCEAWVGLTLTATTESCLSPVTSQAAGEGRT